MRTTRKLMAVCTVLGSIALLPGLSMAASCCGGCGKGKEQSPKADAAAATASAATATAKAETPVKAQTNCPIMGGAINKQIYADHEGKRVYFCCAGCPETFKKDPAKYIKQLEDAGVTLEKTPAKEAPAQEGKKDEAPAKEAPAK